MFDLIALRRAVQPTLEAHFPAVKFAGHISEEEFAGVYDASLSETVAEVKSRENTFACNAAKLKYYDTPTGTRVFEHGSYAYRPRWFFGKWQLHIRLFPHVAGTAFITHWEINPYWDPVRHYEADDWDPEAGVKLARKEYDLSESESLEGIIS